MHTYYVGEKITWNSAIDDSWLRNELRGFIRKHGEIVVVCRISKSDNSSHPQTIWLTEHAKDRFSGWWFEPMPSGFTLDALE